jgi:hypothetical protein
VARGAYGNADNHAGRTPLPDGPDGGLDRVTGHDTVVHVHGRLPLEIGADLRTVFAKAVRDNLTRPADLVGDIPRWHVIPAAGSLGHRDRLIFADCPDSEFLAARVGDLRTTTTSWEQPSARHFGRDDAAAREAEDERIFISAEHGPHRRRQFPAGIHPIVEFHPRLLASRTTIAVTQFPIRLHALDQRTPSQL